jgi:glycosyltransferase involved in cell wall biosynthesis
MRVALVSPAISNPARLYGAEKYFVGLYEALRRCADVDWLQVPVSEATWEDVLRSYVQCYDMDVSPYELVISTKNPTFMVQHPNHVCWLVHQIRVFYDRFDDEYGQLDPNSLQEQKRRRELIHTLDNAAFSRIRRIFAIGHEPARRLKHYNHFDAGVLYPPALNSGHHCGGQEYLLLPGRLHRWKRVDLAIRAMKRVPHDIPMLVPGTGEDEGFFREIADGDKRIQFLGFVSDEELLSLYANCLAVLFPTKDEDFGYVAVEAMLSHKPVITCTDSGEPARMVGASQGGFVVRPEPEEIAGAIRTVIEDRALARALGENAFRGAPSQSWGQIIEKLLPVRSSVVAAFPERDNRPAAALTELDCRPHKKGPIAS